MATYDKKKKIIKKNEPSFTEKTDLFFQRNVTLIVTAIVLFSVVFSLLLFDMKVTIAGDDSGYILSAKEFLEGTQFPLWHGSFYPMFLSFFLFFCGVKLLLFKLLSLLFIVSQLVILYYALKKVVSPTIVSLSILLFSVNAFLLYHSSQTFSEPIFMFIQACILWLFFKLEHDFNGSFNDKKSWKWLLLLGFCMFLLVITRNIGISILVACILYFSINKRFINASYVVASFFLFYIPFLLYKSFYWHVKGAGFEDQLLFSLYKDPYNRSKGVETFSSMIDRFCINSNLYLSRNLLEIFGLKNQASDVSTTLTIILYLIFIAIGIYLFKKSKELFFLLLYVGISLAATFITQQIIWDQLRLILVFAPLILIIIGFTCNEVFKRETYKKYQPILFGFFIMLFFFSLFKTIKQTKLNNATIVQNLGGNILSGYTPDWYHYIEACRWIKTNVPSNKNVGVRKPNIAFIYSSRNYVGIIKSFDVTIDDVIANCSKNKSKIYTILELKNLKQLKSLDSILKYGENMDATIFHKKGETQFVYGCNEQRNKLLLNTLSNCNIKYSQNLKTLKTFSDSSIAIFPDSAYSFIKKNKLHYIICASLRTYPDQKTKSIMGNINKMLYMTSFKYPTLFSKINQFGADEDEPAIIYQVNDVK